MRHTFYVTTPIYYVNDNPHIGHAYTMIFAARREIPFSASAMCYINVCPQGRERMEGRGDDEKRYIG